MSTAQAIAAREVSFHYDFLSVQDLRVETSTNVKTGKKTVDKVFVKDEPLDATERFWTSLYARFGFNSAVMKYFSHEEVFTRISQVEPKDRMRLCIERGPSGDGSLLGCPTPTNPSSFTTNSWILSVATVVTPSPTTAASWNPNTPRVLGLTPSKWVVTIS